MNIDKLRERDRRRIAAAGWCPDCKQRLTECVCEAYETDEDEEDDNGN